MIASQSFEVLRARAGLIFFTLVVTVITTAAVSLLLPDKYTSNATFVVHFKETGLNNAILPQRLAESYLGTQIDIVQSPSVALKVVDRMKLAENPDFVGDMDIEDPALVRQQLAKNLLENLEVEPSRESRMVSVSFTAQNANDAASIANAFTQAYIDTNLELSVNPAQRSAEWFNQELDRLRNQLQAAQKKLSAHQLENGILTSDTGNDVDAVQLNELSRRLVEARAEKSSAQANQQEINKLIATKGRFEMLPEVQMSVFIQGIKSELLRKQAELSQLSSRLGRNHPEYLRVAAEAGTLHSRLNREIQQVGRGVIMQADKNVQLAKEREQSLVNEIEVQRQRLMNLNQSKDELPTLQQDVLIAQKVYDAVLEQYNESNLKSRLKITNIAVLSHASPPSERSSPKFRINLIVGFILGLMLGIGFAFLAEIADPVIRTEDQFDEVLGAPLIGYLEPGNYVTYTGRHDK